jgi:formylglycine-generating enzyme required for sulfatase activity
MSDSHAGPPSSRLDRASDSSRTCRPRFSSTLDRAERPSRITEKLAARRTLVWLGIASAVVMLVGISYSVHWLAGGDLTDAGAQAAASAREQLRAELVERVAARRAEIDQMLGVTVRVPGGTFEMGALDGNHNEQPPHRVDVAPFEIDETEVTVAAYQMCVAAGKCESPGAGPACNWGTADRRGHPVNCVSWQQAHACCAWAGKRLPTEEEWEWAARGPQANRFPWGEAPPASRACWNQARGNAGESAGTCPVADHQADRSSFGVLGLGGNVREWTASRFCPYARDDCRTDSLVMRGGAWADADPLSMRASLRNAKKPDYRSPSVGFRCARHALPARGGQGTAGAKAQ